MTDKASARWSAFTDEELAHLSVSLIERSMHVEEGAVPPSEVPRLLADEVIVERKARRSIQPRDTVTGEVMPEAICEDSACPKCAEERRLGLHEAGWWVPCREHRRA